MIATKASKFSPYQAAWSDPGKALDAKHAGPVPVATAAPTVTAKPEATPKAASSWPNALRTQLGTAYRSRGTEMRTWPPLVAEFKDEAEYASATGAEAKKKGAAKLCLPLTRVQHALRDPRADGVAVFAWIDATQSLRPFCVARRADIRSLHRSRMCMASAEEDAKICHMVGEHWNTSDQEEEVAAPKASPPSTEQLEALSLAMLDAVAGCLASFTDDGAPRIGGAYEFSAAAFFAFPG